MTFSKTGPGTEISETKPDYQKRKMIDITIALYKMDGRVVALKKVLKN